MCYRWSIVGTGGSTRRMAKATFSGVDPRQTPPIWRLNGGATVSSNRRSRAIYHRLVRCGTETRTATDKRTFFGATTDTTRFGSERRDWSIDRVSARCDVWRSSGPATTRRRKARSDIFWRATPAAKQPRCGSIERRDVASPRGSATYPPVWTVPIRHAIKWVAAQPASDHFGGRVMHPSGFRGNRCMRRPGNPKTDLPAYLRSYRNREIRRLTASSPFWPGSFWLERVRESNLSSASTGHARRLNKTASCGPTTPYLPL